jgi:hypothetical protein
VSPRQPRLARRKRAPDRRWSSGTAAPRAAEAAASDIRDRPTFAGGSAAAAGLFFDSVKREVQMTEASVRRCIVADGEERTARSQQRRAQRGAAPQR